MITAGEGAVRESKEAEAQVVRPTAARFSAKAYPSSRALRSISMLVPGATGTGLAGMGGQFGLRSGEMAAMGAIALVAGY